MKESEWEEKLAVQGKSTVESGSEFHFLISVPYKLLKKTTKFEFEIF